MRSFATQYSVTAKNEWSLKASSVYATSAGPGVRGVAGSGSALGGADRCGGKSGSPTFCCGAFGSAVADPESLSPFGSTNGAAMNPKTCGYPTMTALRDAPRVPPNDVKFPVGSSG